MLRPERKTKNEIAGFRPLNPRKPANSKGQASPKPTHYQQFMPFFTADCLQNTPKRAPMRTFRPNEYRLLPVHSRPNLGYGGHKEAKGGGR
jgi:hypothetical protein